MAGLTAFYGELSAAQTQVYSAPVTAVMTMVVDVLATTPLLVTLIDPNNQPITPQTPATNPQVAYTVITSTFSGAADDIYWQHQYTNLDFLYIEHLGVDDYMPPVVDSVQNGYITAAYTARHFEGEPLAMLAAGDRAEDLNGNGLYDQLSITVTFDVLTPGVYKWMGVLVDADGARIADAADAGWLDAQTPATFRFAGGQMRSAERNGPYRLTDVYVMPAGGDTPFSYFYNVHTTPAYAFTQFDATPVALKRLTHEAIDLNGNGLYDHLVISATVAAILPEGDYTWSGRHRPRRCRPANSTPGSSM